MGFYPSVPVAGDTWFDAAGLVGSLVPTDMHPGVYWVFNWYDLEDVVEEFSHENNNLSVAFTQLVVLGPGACP